MTRLTTLIATVFLTSACAAPRGPVFAPLEGTAATPAAFAQAKAGCIHLAMTALPAPAPVRRRGCADLNCGFAGGFATGAAIAQQAQLQRARQDLYETCMLGEGWAKQAS